MSKMKKILAIFLVMAMVWSFAFAAVGTGMATANDIPVPDIVSNKVIVLNPKVDLAKVNYGIITRIGPNYIGIAIDNRSNLVLKTDLIIFAPNIPKLEITQGVVVDVEKGKADIYFAHSKILALPWTEISAWDPAMNRIETQDLVYGKVLKIKKTGALESETDHCCQPAIKKTWYYVDLSIATENNTKTMIVEVKVPENEMKAITKGSGIWLSLRYQKLYILAQN